MVIFIVRLRSLLEYVVFFGLKIVISNGTATVLLFSQYPPTVGFASTKPINCTLRTNEISNIETITSANAVLFINSTQQY